MAISKTIYDALIIGGGPGGLSTALGLARQNRTCLVISHNHFRNDGIEASHTVLGHDHIHPQKVWARAREQLERYQTVSYADADISLARKQLLPNNRPGYVIESKDGRSWTGRSLVLATGVKDIFPDLPGYAQNWPQNIYQCLFCDGWERRHSQKAILGYPSLTLHDAKIASMALGQDSSRAEDGHARVTLLTNGSPPTSDVALTKQIKALVARGVKVEPRKVLRLENAESDRGEGVYVYLENSDPNTNGGSPAASTERIHFGYLFHKPRTTPTAPALIAQLGLEVDESGAFGDTVKARPPMQSTSVPGVFVAGDVGSAMTHVTTAMVSGLGAAVGIVTFLNDWEDEMALMNAAMTEASENEDRLLTAQRTQGRKEVLSSGGGGGVTSGAAAVEAVACATDA